MPIDDRRGRILATGERGGGGGAPWNSGQMLQTATGPRLVYWPSDSSKKKSGMPVKISMMAYGIRKAPVDGHGCQTVQGSTGEQTGTRSDSDRI